MPASPRKSERSKRPIRCQYSEEGRRCVRNGEGAPPLCNVHRVLLQDVGKPARAGSPIEVLDELFSDLLSGEKVSKDRLREAADQLFGAWGMGGGMAGGFYPDNGPDDGGGARFKPPRGFPGWGRQQVPEDPEVEFNRQQAAAAVRARQVLGFAASEPLTVDSVRKRHRELAKKHHPDRGGQLAKMQEVNAAVDVLMGSLKT